MPEPGRTGAVVLVGLMGSGKTTVGKKVAKLLGWRFLDADVELERRTGRSVAAWFEAEGEPGFRRAESELLAAILDDAGPHDPLVLGAGGGVVVQQPNRERLSDAGVTVVYLHADPAFLASRTQRKAHRPLLVGDPVQVMTEMYEARDRLYREVSDAVVEVRPAHELGAKPKWRLAEQVVEHLVALDVIDAPADLEAQTR